ncbi:MAG: transglycosylase domain-containing protein [Bdellovibrionales bacterium]|nr:transglycosylase domain-containing protein [Bdellovibrionales bacterium]
MSLFLFLFFWVKSNLMITRYLKLASLCLLLSSCAGPAGCSPRFSDLRTQYPHVIYHGPKDPSEVVIKKTPPPNWVSLNNISKLAQEAVLVSEDWAFYQHPGYDEKQIRDAIEESVAAGKMKRGASTITQQVARNIYLSKEKSIVRKVREIWIATKMEKVLGKKKILELYLNIAEWGEGIFGIGQASQKYFQKQPSQLTAKEGAFLAMLLPSPKKYSISFRHNELTPYARRTIRSILGKMVQARFLTPEDRDQEWSTPLVFETKFDPTLNAQDTAESGADEVLDAESKDENSVDGSDTPPADTDNP